MSTGTDTSRRHARFLSAAMVAATLLGGSLSARPRVAQTSEPLPRFEVASIRPTAEPNSPVQLLTIRTLPGGRLEVIDARLRELVGWAYTLQPGQRVLGAYEMLERRFAISAKAATDLPFAKADDAQAPIKLMTQALLRDRFGLRVGWKAEELPVMVVKRISQTQLGPRLTPLSGLCNDVLAIERTRRQDDAFPQRCGTFLNGGRLTAAVDRFQDALRVLSVMSRVPFVDGTGLSGGFAMTMEFDAATLEQGINGNPDLPSFTAALRDELGLRIERQKSAVPMLLVEQVEEPAPN